MQARPDREHEVGLRSKSIRVVAARDPHRPDPGGVVGDEARLPRHRLDNRETVALGERSKVVLGEGVVDSAACDHERAFGVS